LSVRAQGAASREAFGRGIGGGSRKPFFARDLTRSRKRKGGKNRRK